MIKKTYIFFGQAVKRARKENRITQKILSGKVNILCNYISDIKLGRDISSIDKLIILANKLEIDLTILKNDGNTLLENI